MKVIDYQDYLNCLNYLKSLSEKVFNIVCDDGIKYYRYTTSDEIYEYYILGHLYYNHHSHYYFSFREPSRTKKEIEIFEKQIQRIKKLERINE
jgi:hypothetical protein